MAVQYIVTPDKEITFMQGISNCPAPYGLEYGMNEPSSESLEGQEIFSSPHWFWSPTNRLLNGCQEFFL
jgi:hypothetical protein